MTSFYVFSEREGVIGQIATMHGAVWCGAVQYGAVGVSAKEEGEDRIENVVCMSMGRTGAHIFG
jgi:hypothetical protein